MSPDRAIDAPRSPRRRRRFRRYVREVPILPSMITLGNLFCGFLAMSKAVDAARGGDTEGAVQLGLFGTAALLVFLGMVFDALDGTAARLTRQTSAFGAQLDSLADIVAFGVAPAFLAKVLIDLHSGADQPLPAHPRLYHIAAAVYVMCAAMRLARFNVETGSPEADEHREFAGIPTPAAAAFVCAQIVFVATPRDEPGVISRRLLPPELDAWIIVSLPVTLVMLGLLMISRFPYPHLIVTLARGRPSFPFFATLMVMVGIAALEWQVALAVVASIYVASGICIGLWRFITRGRMEDDDGGPDDDADEDPAEFLAGRVSGGGRLN